MSWQTLRDAIHASIVEASGLPVGQVVWKFQDVGQPPMDYIAVAVGSSGSPGQDGVSSHTDLTRAAGQEVELRVEGLREITIGLEVFTVATAGEDDALDRAELIRSKLRLPAARDLLGAAGISPLEIGQVGYAPSIVAAGFRGRATLDIRCLAPARAASEFTGYIKTAAGTLSTSGGGIAGTNERDFNLGDV